MRRNSLPRPSSLTSLITRSAAGSAVRDDGALHVRDDGLHVGLVKTEDGCAVKGDTIYELDEGVLNVFERGVLIEMLAVDGGDHRDYRSEHEEAAVAFVGFDDEIFAFAQARVGAGLVYFSADDERGIEVGSVHDRGDHRSRGGFAMK